jgi:putative membrane protein
VTPEDNDTSRTLSKQASDKRSELGKLKGADFDKAYIANEVAYHKDGKQRAGDPAHPGGGQSGAEEPPLDRIENLPGSSAAREHVATDLK